MHITIVAQSCRLGNQADFVLEPDRSLTQISSYDKNISRFVIEVMRLSDGVILSYHYILRVYTNIGCFERSFSLNVFFSDILPHMFSYPT